MFVGKRVFGRKVIRSVFLVILLSALCVASLPAISRADRVPKPAPMNPEFLHYLKIKEAMPVDVTGDGIHGMGDIPPPIKLPRYRGDKAVFGMLATIPSVYDARKKNKVTPVRDQGACGSCWAFAAFASLESSLKPKENNDFAEADLVDYHGFDFATCDGGGHHLMATAYLARWSGPVNEKDYPYPYLQAAPGVSVKKHVQDVYFLPARNSYLDNDAIKAAVMSYGAVHVSFYFDDFYYNPSTYSYYCNGTQGTNHAVAVIGWDDNYSKEKFNPQPPGNGAFLVKNSWGTDWGNKGYFYLSYYDVSFMPRAVYYNAVAPTDSKRAYEYDPLGWVTSLGYGSNTAWFANIFTAASSASKIKAASFYTPTYQSPYEIRIYKNCTNGNPTSGSLVTTLKGTIPYPGYHTVRFKTPAKVSPGKKFSVVVKLTTPGYNYPIPIEMPLRTPDYTFDYSSAANAWLGQSFSSNDGVNWRDVVYDYPKTNVCLKAFGL